MSPGLATSLCLEIQAVDHTSNHRSCQAKENCCESGAPVSTFSHLHPSPMKTDPSRGIMQAGCIHGCLCVLILKTSASFVNAECLSAQHLQKYFTISFRKDSLNSYALCPRLICASSLHLPGLKACWVYFDRRLPHWVLILCYLSDCPITLSSSMAKTVLIQSAKHIHYEGSLSGFCSTESG